MGVGIVGVWLDFRAGARRWTGLASLGLILLRGRRVAGVLPAFRLAGSFLDSFEGALVILGDAGEVADNGEQGFYVAGLGLDHGEDAVYVASLLLDGVVQEFHGLGQCFVPVRESFESFIYGHCWPPPGPERAARFRSASPIMRRPALRASGALVARVVGLGVLGAAGHAMAWTFFARGLRWRGGLS